MTPCVLARVLLNELLDQGGTARLRAWLQARDLTLSLLELDDERHRRGIEPPGRPRGWRPRATQAPGRGVITGVKQGRLTAGVRLPSPEVSGPRFLGGCT